MRNLLNTAPSVKSTFESSNVRPLKQPLSKTWREAEVREADWEEVALGTARAANETLIDFDLDLDLDAKTPSTTTDASSHAGVVSIPAACLAELDQAIHAYRLDPRPTTELSHLGFSMPETTRFMSRVRSQVESGIGYAVIDRIPVEKYSTEEGKVVGWLLANLLGPVVDQKHGGTRLYDVKDTGKKLSHGVRRSITNLGQDFHTDGGWLTNAPGVVGLFCLQPAAEGGMTRIINLVEAHDHLRATQPELFERLCQPFWWDRQAEHGPNESKVSFYPVFGRDEHGPTIRHYQNYIKWGYEHAGQRLDSLGRRALDAYRDAINEVSTPVEFNMTAGQFQFVNNRQLAHARTAFKDSDVPGESRHLLRIWNRFEGDTSLEG